MGGPQKLRKFAQLASQAHRARARERMQPTDPNEILQHVVRAAEGRYDPATWTWFAEGIASWLNATEPVSLETCLGLAGGRGEATVKATLARARRNHWLLIAWHVVSDDPSLSPRQRSALLADEIERFETRGIWRRLQESADPLDGLSELRTALYHVFKLGAHVPRSTEHVHRIATTFGVASDVAESGV